MTAFRLARGGRIDRAARLRFTFDGRAYEGLAGDTLASALLANDVLLVARSFKYHRPRGVFAAGADEPNALVQLETGARTEPNLRATQVELYEGLHATGINAWPSVTFDLGAINGAFAPLLPAGFYYKTFLGSQKLWQRLFEPAIRRMAGLGQAPTLPDPDAYDRMYAHCDVLVVGAGPAGLAAALAAGRTGARVILADEQAEFGGSLLGRRDWIDGASAVDWVERVTGELRSLPEAVLLPRTTVFGYYDHNYLMAAERRTDHHGDLAPPGIARQRLWHIRARQVVLATGAHERPLVFADNDRPGVMLTSAAQTYLNRYGVAPGRRIAIFTNNDGAYELARDAMDAGLQIAAVVDLRAGLEGALPVRVWREGVTVLQGHAVTGTRGRRRLAGIEVARLDSDGTGIVGRPFEIDCDLLAVSGGWNPAVHLFAQAQGRLRYDGKAACFVPGRAIQGRRNAGAANGTFALGAALAEGLAAGRAAARDAGFTSGDPVAQPACETVPQGPIRPLWVVPSAKAVGRGTRKHFVDLQSDVTAADILLAAREGMRSIEHVKRYTTTGMGTDQGRTSNVNALAVLSEALRRPIAETGTTTFRPPYTPVAFGLLAGRDVGEFCDPVRRTPMQRWHAANGAVFEDVAQWKRPRYYPRPGETMRQAVSRECLAVRNAVGVLDASTLGKIDIQGPDAAAFLDRVYTNRFSNLGIGRCRYGLMCQEDGMVFDDGVTTRLGDRHFLMTTTTGGAGAVLDWLEEWLQTEWTDLRVWCTSVTEQWAVVSLAGPKAREVLREVAPGLPLSREDFPFLSMREAAVAGVPARIFRVSFTGELSYEINVPWDCGMHVWTAVMRAGERHGITPYGTEAMHVLRAEKGYIIVGQETDGTVTPFDLGMGRIVSRQKDFLGRRSLARSDTARDDRKQLVGLLPADPQIVPAEGAQIVADRDAPVPVPMLGHVTSAYWSATLGRGFALALMKDGRRRIGETVTLADRGRFLEAQVTVPMFYDSEGARRDG